MSQFMTSLECAEITSELANFLDRRPDLSCSQFLVQRPIDTQELLVSLDVASQYDPKWTEPAAPLPSRFCTSPSYRMDLSYLRPLGLLPEKRPSARNAILALGSVAAKLPVDIVEANGSLLEYAIQSAPHLEICCAVDMEGVDRLNAFLEELGPKHLRDASGMPRVETDYPNHNDQPIAVRLAFYAALKKFA